MTRQELNQKWAIGQISDTFAKLLLSHIETFERLDMFVKSGKEYVNAHMEYETDKYQNVL